MSGSCEPHMRESSVIHPDGLDTARPRRAQGRSSVAVRMGRPGLWSPAAEMQLIPRAWLPPRTGPDQGPSTLLLEFASFLIWASWMEFRDL